MSLNDDETWFRLMLEPFNDNLGLIFRYFFPGLKPLEGSMPSNLL